MNSGDFALRPVPDAFFYNENLLEKDVDKSPLLYGLDVYRLKTMLERGFIFPETQATLQNKGTWVTYASVWPKGFQYMYYAVPKIAQLARKEPGLVKRFMDLNPYYKTFEMYQAELDQSVFEYARNAASSAFNTQRGVDGFDYDISHYLLSRRYLADNGEMDFRLANEEIVATSILKRIHRADIPFSYICSVLEESVEYSGALLHFGDNLPCESKIQLGVEADTEVLIFTKEVLRPYHIDGVRMSNADYRLFEYLCGRDDNV